MIDKVIIAICTYNPNFQSLQQVIDSCDVPSLRGRIVVFDSASTNGVPILIANKFNLEYVFCVNPGTAYARFTALAEQRSDEMLIFVDDDNILGENFASFALEIGNANPLWGVFGGKLTLPSDYQINDKLKHFLPYLAIKNLGDYPRDTAASLHWNELEPPGAGMCVRPEVAKYIVEKFESGDSGILTTGAIHAKQFRGEDSYIARQAHFLRFNWGYHPSLTLEHRFAPNRLSIRYLYPLLFRFGVSDIHLNNALHIQPAYQYPQSFRSLLGEIIFHLAKGRAGVPTALRVFGQFYACKC